MLKSANPEGFKSRRSDRHVSRIRPSAKVRPVAESSLTGAVAAAGTAAVSRAAGPNRVATADGRSSATSGRRAKWASERPAGPTRQEIEQAEMTSAPGLLEPMDIQVWKERKGENHYEVRATMRTSFPPNLTYKVISNFDQATRVFRDVAEYSSEPRGNRTFRIKQSLRWKYLFLSGTFTAVVLTTCDDANRTITFQLDEPGFMKNFQGQWSVRPIHASPASMPQPAATPSSSSSSSSSRNNAASSNRNPFSLFPSPIGTMMNRNTRSNTPSASPSSSLPWLPLRMPALLAATLPLAPAFARIAGPTVPVVSRSAARPAAAAAAAAAATTAAAAGESGQGECIGSELYLGQKIQPFILPPGPIGLVYGILHSQARRLFHDVCVEASSLAPPPLAAASSVAPLPHAAAAPSVTLIKQQAQH